MNISVDNINFQSKIKFIDSKLFRYKQDSLNPLICEVPYPWTVETMKTGKELYTTGLMECIGGIFTNGETSSMLHLATRNEETAKRDNVKHFDISNIEKVLLSNFDITKKGVHGIILGAWDLNKKYLDQFISLIKKYNVPYSIMANRKNVHLYGRFSMLFSTYEDTLYLTNSLTDKRSYNKLGLTCGHEIDVKNNSIIYNQYTAVNDNNILTYNKTRKKSDIKTFMEYQFNYVSLCEFDEWA